MSLSVELAAVIWNYVVLHSSSLCGAVNNVVYSSTVVSIHVYRHGACCFCRVAYKAKDCN
jgi:hypothetical protein